VIEEIKKHFEKEYPREGCGVIAIVKGKKKFFPCKNIAEGEGNFILCSKDWFRIKQQADIFAVVHSHPSNCNEASIYDIDNCNVLGLPYYIFSYPDMELNILQPKKNFSPLIGREYKFGVADCFEAIRNWLDTENIHIPPRELFEFEWWKKGEDYFTEENIKNWNHIKVDTPQKNDVLVFSVNSQVANHCGVYLGNDIFYHHARNRLSCRESLYPFWNEYLTGIYRYEA